MFRFLLILLTLIEFTGCARWGGVFRGQSRDDLPELLQKSQMSPDSVVLEISILKVPANRSATLRKLFDSLDVTRIDLDQRIAWDQNGLRAAVSGTTMPIEYETLLENEIVADDSDENSDEAKMAPRRHIQARSGKTIRIATKPVESELAWFYVDPDGYRKGGTAVSAQTEFEVRSYSLGDGSVKLMLTPEILFGEPRQVVTASNASLRYEMKREALPFSGLRIEAGLALGESLVLAPDLSRASDLPNDFGLGRTFFRSQEGFLKMIVVRLAQSQKDDLFDSSPHSQPLESVTE
ncbi:MAG: hypothetical protein VX768_10755 [Planctomycetota bacterium]|nr:hypothetical protein [Planctomycetota bacterium]